MAEPPAKIRRVLELRSRLPYVSQTAFAKVCQLAQTEELPLVSRNTLRKARNSVACQATPYGQLTKKLDALDKDGNRVEFEVVCPIAMLWAAAQKHHFCLLLKRTFERTPPSRSSPWDILIYNDEVTPGNVRKADNKKKMQVVYWSFLQFGPDALSKEDFWLTATVLRSTITNSIEGGISAIMCRVLRTFFCGPHKLQLGGVTVTAQDRAVAAVEFRLFAKLGGLVSDEAAIHATWLCKGATGIKCCVKCMYTVSPAWLAADEVGPGSRFKFYNKLFDEDDCELHTKDTIIAIVDDLQRCKPITAAGAFAAKERAVGFTHCEQSLLLDNDLRPEVDPSTQTIFDWPHSTLQGVFPAQIALFERDLRPHRIEFYKLLHEYLQNWRVPVHSRKTCGLDVFNDRRRGHMKADKNFKASMSETLSVHAIIYHWIHTVVEPTGLLPVQCKAFRYLSALITMLQAAARGPRVLPPAAMQRTIRKHLEAFAEAYPTEGWIPKFHHQVHYPSTYEKFEMLPHTVPLERKHKGVKAYAEALDNTHPQWDSNILREVTCDSLLALEDGEHLDLTPGLLDPKPPPPEILANLEVAFFGPAPWMYSARARHDSSGYCGAGDAIAFKDGVGTWAAGQVMFCFSLHATGAAMVAPFALITREKKFSSWRNTKDHCIAVELKDIIESLTHRMVGDVVTLLHPYVLQA